MTLLAVESSGAACSAAVWQAGVLLAHRYVPMQRGHAGALLPLLRETMHLAAVDWPALRRIAVTVGPGSFTGIRVGLAAARGLGLALGIPVVGCTSLEVVAAGVPLETRAGRDLLVVLDSRRRDLFAQLFDADLRPLQEPVACAPDRLAGLLRDRSVLVAGDAVDALPAGLSHLPRLAVGAPDAAVLARLVGDRAVADLLPATPLYLRPPDAVAPAGGGRLRP